MSPSDSALHAGLPGDSYYDAYLAELILVEHQYAYSLYAADGSVEIRETAPSCPGCLGCCTWHDESYQEFTCSPCKIIHQKF